MSFRLEFVIEKPLNVQSVLQRDFPVVFTVNGVCVLASRYSAVVVIASI